MEKIIVMVFGFVLYSFACAQNIPDIKRSPQKNENKKTVKKLIYTCVMHPEVQMSEPGKCPKCGMALVKKIIKSTKPQSQPLKKTPIQKSKDTLHTEKKDKGMDINMP